MSVSLNIPWIWFVPFLNPIFSRCWDKSMASVCLGKTTWQKWMARLHIRGVRARAHYHHHSRGWSCPGLTVTTALFGQSSSATMLKSFREQVHPNTVRNKQDILEKFRRVSIVKFPRQEGGTIDGKKKPTVAILFQKSITRAIFRLPAGHILQKKAKNFDRHCSESSKGVLSHLLQSNSHYKHPLRFAPNWFDDVMMTMCHGTKSSWR